MIIRNLKITTPENSEWIIQNNDPFYLNNGNLEFRKDDKFPLIGYVVGYNKENDTYIGVNKGKHFNKC